MWKYLIQVSCLFACLFIQGLAVKVEAINSRVIIQSQDSQIKNLGVSIPLKPKKSELEFRFLADIDNNLSSLGYFKQPQAKAVVRIRAIP